MKKKSLMIIIISSLILIVLAIVGFKIYELEKEEKLRQEEFDNYSQDKTRFYKNTFINDLNVSEQTLDEVIDILKNEINEKEISIYLDNNEIFKSKVLNLKPEIKIKTSLIKDLLNSQKLTYDEYFSNEFKKEYSLNDFFEIISIDTSVIEYFSEKNKVMPENAQVSFNNETNQYYIQEEVIGNYLKENILESSLISSIIDNTLQVILTDEDFYRPEIIKTDEILINTVEFLNNFLATEIIYDFEDRTELVPILNLVDIEMSKEQTSTDKIDYDITINEKALEEYIQSLKDKYDTFGLSRSFKNSYGETITVSGGDYGWVISKTKEMAQLKEDILKGEDVKRAPIYLYKGQRRVEDELGNSYVEISLEKQHIWLYVNGELIIDSDCVTGNYPNMATPPGVYCLTYKTQNAVLRGADYATPVDYWMPFNKNIGMHDATWRNKFGGTIYKGNGSHGCINLPYKTAQTIYKHLTMEMPIILY